MACNKDRIKCELTDKMFSKAEWPPKVQLERDGEPTELTDFDVSWILCTVLGMRWEDAHTIIDPTERMFLYSKALQVTEALVTQKIEMDKARGELEAAMKKKIDASGGEPTDEQQAMLSAIQSPAPMFDPSSPSQTDLKL